MSSYQERCTLTSLKFHSVYKEFSTIIASYILSLPGNDLFNSDLMCRRKYIIIDFAVNSLKNQNTNDFLDKNYHNKINYYKEIQVLSQVLKKTSNESCQMNDMSRLMFFKYLQCLFFISFCFKNLECYL